MKLRKLRRKEDCLTNTFSLLVTIATPILMVYAEGNNVFTHLKTKVPALVGVGCPAHILNNCVHHGVNQMSLDSESIIYKTYHHFSMYTVRTEKLEDSVYSWI